MKDVDTLRPELFEQRNIGQLIGLCRGERQSPLPGSKAERGFDVVVVGNTPDEGRIGSEPSVSESTSFLCDLP